MSINFKNAAILVLIIVVAIALGYFFVGAMTKNK